MPRLHNHKRGRSFSSGRQQTITTTATNRVVSQKERLSQYYNNDSVGDCSASPSADRTTIAAMTFSTDSLAPNSRMFSTQAQVPTFSWYPGQGQEVATFNHQMNSSNYQSTTPLQQWSALAPPPHHEHRQLQNQQQQQMVNYFISAPQQPPFSVLHSSTQQSSHYALSAAAATTTTTIPGGHFNQLQAQARLPKEPHTRSTLPPPPPPPPLSSSSVLASGRSNGHNISASPLSLFPPKPSPPETLALEKGYDLTSPSHRAAAETAATAQIKANPYKTANVEDPSSSIRNAMAELSSLSQRWTRASYGDDISSNGVKSRLPPAKTTNKKVKYELKGGKQEKNILSEIAHAAAAVVAKKRDIVSTSPNSTASEAPTATIATGDPWTKIKSVSVQHNVPMGTNWDRSGLSDHMPSSEAILNVETGHSMPNGLAAVGVKEHEVNPIMKQYRFGEQKKEMISGEKIPAVPILVSKTNNQQTNNRMSMISVSDEHDDEEMEISDDEDGDNEQVTNDQTLHVKGPPRTGTNMIQASRSDPMKATSTMPINSLAMTLRNDLAEKKLRLAMAHKRKALEMAKAKLLRAQIEKEALKANRKNSELKKSTDEVKKISNITAFSMKSLVIEGINTSGPADKVYPIKLETSPAVVPSIVDSNSSITIKEQPNPSRSNSPTKEIKASSVEAEKLKLNLELAKRKLKLKTLLNAKAKKEAENNQGSSDGDKTPKRDESATSKKTPDEVLPVSLEAGQQNMLKKETATELRRRQELLRESIKQSKETNKGLKDDKEIRELKDLVEKQRRILQTQGAKITTSTKNIQQCNDQLQEINALKSESEMKIQNLMKKRVMMEKMIASVSKNIIDSRRKRMKRKRNLNANDRRK